MVDTIEVSCPDCGETNLHRPDWLQRHSEVDCKYCGAAIDVAANKDWGELKRLYNAQNSDGPVRRRLP